MKRWPIIVVATAAAAICIGALFYYAYTSTSKTNTEMSRQSPRDAALREARDFNPPENLICTQVLTPAIHDETGANFTFPTGCLAPGWSYDGSAQMESETTNPSEIYAQQETASIPEDEETSEHPNSDDTVDESTRHRAIDAKERIIDAARKFKPSSTEKCKNSRTPATHSETGLRYKFLTTCLPAGWEPDNEKFERAKVKLHQQRY